MRAARILERLDALFAIDRAAGTNRPGLGAGEQRAFDMVAGWMEDAGLQVSVDPAGNLYGRLPGSDPALARGVERIPPGHAARRRPLRRRAGRARRGRRAGGDRRGRRRRRARWRPSPSGWRRAGGSAAAASAAGRCAACWRTTRPTCAIADGVTPGRGVRRARPGRAAGGGLARAAARLLGGDAHRAGADARRRRPPAGRRHLDRRDGGYRDRLRRPPRPCRDDADGAARRRAGRRGRVRHRGAGRRPVDPRGRLHGRPADRVAPARPTRSPAASSCSPTCGRPTPSGWSS